MWRLSPDRPRSEPCAQRLAEPQYQHHRHGERPAARAGGRDSQPMKNRLIALGLGAALALPALALAQQAPAPAPAWAQGRPGSLASSPLAPNAPKLTVTPLEQVPVGKLTLPAGFKAEVYAHGMPGARTMA